MAAASAAPQGYDLPTPFGPSFSANSCGGGHDGSCVTPQVKSRVLKWYPLNQGSSSRSADVNKPKLERNICFREISWWCSRTWTHRGSSSEATTRISGTTFGSRNVLRELRRREPNSSWPTNSTCCCLLAWRSSCGRWWQWRWYWEWMWQWKLQYH